MTFRYSVLQGGPEIIWTSRSRPTVFYNYENFSAGPARQTILTLAIKQ
jgi:hypothetical protein